MPIRALFTLRMDVRYREALDRAAEDESRSVGNLMEKITGEWLRQNGYINDDGNAPETKKRKR